VIHIGAMICVVGCEVLVGWRKLNHSWSWFRAHPLLLGSVWT